jgi:hypothetical protein
MGKKAEPAAAAASSEPAHRPKCGLVMPMSLTDGLKPDHWTDVKGILQEVATKAGFDAEMVSYADEVGIIHKRIVENLFELPIVICDVSGRNPNVMFELGMRLMADKAVVIVKDDVTPYSFDTSPIEHVPYPRTLRYSKIEVFKKDLALKLRATYEQSQRNDYSPFVSHFTKLKVVRRPESEVSESEFKAELLEELVERIGGIEQSIAQLSMHQPWGTVFQPGSALSLSDPECYDSDRLGLGLTTQPPSNLYFTGDGEAIIGAPVGLGSGIFRNPPR